MIITTFLAHLVAFSSKWMMFFSALKFKAAVLTGNVHLIVSHYTYVTAYKIARPAMMWNPV